MYQLIHPFIFFPVVKIDNQIITPSDQIKYLGIVINNYFNLKSHITNISKKSNYQLLNIHKIGNLSPLNYVHNS